MEQSFSWMFVPGSDEKKLMKAVSLHADVLIYDLEDSVSPHEKKAARTHVKRTIEHAGRVNYVRINSFDSDYFQEDVIDMIHNNLTGIVLPKAENTKQIALLDRMISELEEERKIDTGTIKIVPIIETGCGLYNAYKIASASRRVERLAFGSMDFALDIGAHLTKEGTELLYARSQLVVVSRAAGLKAPIDTVFADIKDPDGFIKEARASKGLGFQGKLLIHPSQIELLSQVYAPTEAEIAHAKRLIQAFETSVLKGEGVLQLDGKMVDLPIVDKAKKMLAAVETHS
ncbi:citrate lyase subunit beta / citryl-CoA lyase [Fictibacillus solisalsi]|uniref:Citrate lyase subunit beta / citryl-CoA lyase n=1 Tax=Fictibacillus solisalsi TaxID=459525 RepID=A0A1G9Y785_9BACL|nr:CoA ester lyase [Fictibacillus solisalsi]SDN04928.1 citrate lyase subunit beta / citryl-CoA lyase [Fictibacillus solisalsi]